MQFRELKYCYLLTVELTVGLSRKRTQAYKYRVAQKSKPLPNDQKIVLNRIKACQ